MSIKVKTKPPTNPVAVTLPTWTDSASVTSYLTSLVSAVLGWVALAHPGFHAPAYVATYVPIVGFVIAGAAQIVNLWTHRKAKIAAIAAQGLVLTTLVEHGYTPYEVANLVFPPVKVDNTVGQTGGPQTVFIA